MFSVIKPTRVNFRCSELRNDFSTCVYFKISMLLYRAFLLFPCALQLYRIWSLHPPVNCSDSCRSRGQDKTDTCSSSLLIRCIRLITIGAKYTQHLLAVLFKYVRFFCPSVSWSDVWNVRWDRSVLLAECHFYWQRALRCSGSDLDCTREFPVRNSAVTSAVVIAYEGFHRFM